MGSIPLLLADEWLHAKPWDPLLAAAVLATIAAVPLGVRIGVAIQRRRRRALEESSSVSEGPRMPQEQRPGAPR